MYKKTILVTGGSGFLGYNLILRLLNEPDVKTIISVDNYITSNKRNLNYDGNNGNGTKKFIDLEFDICSKDFVNYIVDNFEHIDEIYHFASLASPVSYKTYLIETLDVGYIGTKNVLDLCVYYTQFNGPRCRMLFSSTSEVYGDALEHPQKESYYGNVNPYGERSCYDESKRVAETLIYNYNKLHDIETRIVRIFNTYGPYMNINDGRIVTEIIKALLKDKTLYIFGDGNQTRSLCFVDDLIEMILKVMKSDYSYPINIGNDQEITINKLVETARSVYGKQVNMNIQYIDIDKDDPKVRKPCLELNKQILGETNKTSLEQGLLKTIQFFSN
jgi:dTDP-glucose 4,6-dehydratase